MIGVYFRLHQRNIIRKLQTLKENNHEIKARNKHFYLFLILLFKNLVFYIELKSLIITFCFHCSQFHEHFQRHSSKMFYKKDALKNFAIFWIKKWLDHSVLQQRQLLWWLLLHFFASEFCKRVNVSRFLTKWRETHRLMYKESNSFVYKSAVKYYFF